MDLLLMPLNSDLLLTYLQGMDLFEKQHQLRLTGRQVSAPVRIRVERGLLREVQQSVNEDYLYKTFWIAIDKSTNTIVAELGFKGNPTGSGDIEIGYGTMPDFRNKGYMTEAVRQLLAWAQTRPRIKRVIAETLYNNTASHRVLQKNGFAQFRIRGDMIWWEKKMPDPRGQAPESFTIYGG